mgnify:CR=1 FL=1
MAILKLKFVLAIRMFLLWFVLLISCIFPKLVYSERSDKISFIDEIPVMETMSVEPELSFSFDSPSGRIIILIATSDEKEESILRFYDEIMPQLGWTMVGSEYLRGSEKFELISSNNQNGMIWRLTITPN